MRAQRLILVTTLQVAQMTRAAMNGLWSVWRVRVAPSRMHFDGKNRRAWWTSGVPWPDVAACVDWPNDTTRPAHQRGGDP